MMSPSMSQFPTNERGRLYDPDVADDHRTYALLTHLSLVAHAFLPYISILIPIIMWQTKKSESRFINDHGKEAVNFQISLVLYSIVLPVIVLILGVLTFGLGLLLMIPAIFLPFVLGIVGMIMSMTAANRGEYYRYPMTIRFIS